MTIVSAMVHGRSIWKAPNSRDTELADAKRELSAGGSAAKSDHLIIVSAFNRWNEARSQHGMKAAREVMIFMEFAHLISSH